MKRRQDGWVSEYRRKKFLERQKKPFRDFSPNCFGDMKELKIPTTISVMLDLDGTIDGIDDEKASAFIKQLDYLRQKFKADEGVISISTHYSEPSKIIAVLDTFARNLSSNIKIGLSFYYGGIYDYEKKISIPINSSFNRDKVSTFDTYYVNTIGTASKWFAIIDDEIGDDIYLRYQESRPMLLCKPSQNERSVAKNNFMRRATTTHGFDGVLEVMDDYTDSIKDKSFIQIFDTQRNMMMHLSCYDLVEKIRSRDYAFLERYFKEGYADEDDYDDTLGWLLLTNRTCSPTKEELSHLKGLFEFMISHFQEQEQEHNVAKVYQLKKELEKEEE